MQLGRDHAAHGTVVVAETQTGGRGRLKRKWVSPPGGLYMSILLRPALPDDAFSLLPLVTAVAVCVALEEKTTLQPGIKWPNDILLGGKKVCGILVESASFSIQKDKIPYFVAGIGMNVNTTLGDFPQRLQDKITSLSSESNQMYEIDVLMEGIIQKIHHYLSVLRNHGVTEITHAWKKRDALKGKYLSWSRPDGSKIFGKSLGLADNGQYVVRDGHGVTHYILSGDLVQIED